jgi:hypothetical protein
VEWILQSNVATTRQKIGEGYKSFKSFYLLVQWKGYPDNKWTWEPGMRLEHAEESVKEFYEKNPEVPAIMT